MRKKQELSHKLASELFAYDPISGCLRWKKSRQGHVKAWQEAGCINKTTGYRDVFVLGRHYGVHRVAWLMTYGSFPEEEVDHINGIRNDNRIANLRAVTSSENKQNRTRAHKDSATGVLGVRKLGSRYQALIQVNKKQTFLGTFDSLEEASKAYQEAKRRMHVPTIEWLLAFEAQHA